MKHKVFKVCPWSSMFPCSIPLCGCIIFPCVDTLDFVYPFISWWALGCFPRFGNCEWCCYEHTYFILFEFGWWIQILAGNPLSNTTILIISKYRFLFFFSFFPQMVLIFLCIYLGVEFLGNIGQNVQAELFENLPPIIFWSKIPSDRPQI